MTISFGSIGATADGTTALAVAYPSGISAGDLLIMCIASKWLSSVHSIPSPWTSVATESAGLGVEGGSDTGTVNATMLITTATGSESGTVAVGITSGSVAQGIIVRIPKVVGFTWTAVTSKSRLITSDTNPFSVTFDDTLDLVAGDYLGVFCALNTNGPTNFVTETMAASGATLGTRTQRVFTATGTGGDMCINYSDGLVTAGAAAPTITWGATKATSAAGEGPLFLLRLREVAEVGPSSSRKSLALLGVN